MKSKGGDDFTLVGDLTVHGVTKSVTFDLEYLGTGPSMAPGVSVAGFEARGDIDRRDFGINFEGALENGSLIVSNKIVLRLPLRPQAGLSSSVAVQSAGGFAPGALLCTIES